MVLFIITNTNTLHFYFPAFLAPANTETFSVELSHISSELLIFWWLCRENKHPFLIWNIFYSTGSIALSLEFQRRLTFPHEGVTQWHDQFWATKTCGLNVAEVGHVTTGSLVRIRSELPAWKFTTDSAYCRNCLFFPISAKLLLRLATAAWRP